MTDTNTPPTHPKAREYRAAASTLVVTVRSSEQFHADVTADIEALECGDDVDGTPTLAFPSYDALAETFTPRVLDLLEAIRREEPPSINAAARVVDRDVSNVHTELTRLAQLGVIDLVEDGQAKRPVVWFDELVITLPFDAEDTSDTATAPS
ncbi:hypothetical protein BRC93_06785 [Halobacteriales archaeon QS_5_70_15]|nr:MAG: hypothetical protein BRC93_06785 [Halobacteriales archaeon QS_5_70_15]